MAAMFASPKEKIRYFNVFENWLDENLFNSTLTLTAEFLFAGSLPGWPAAGSADTELGVLMEPEVCHGATEVYTRVQA